MGGKEPASQTAGTLDATGCRPWRPGRDSTSQEPVPQTHRSAVRRPGRCVPSPSVREKETAHHHGSTPAAGHRRGRHPRRRPRRRRLDQLGRLLATPGFRPPAPATRSCWPGPRPRAGSSGLGVEGTGSYGAGLARFLRRPRRPGRAGGRPARPRSPPPARQVRPDRRRGGRPGGAGRRGHRHPQGPRRAVEMIRALRVARRGRGQGPHPGRQRTHGAAGHRPRRAARAAARPDRQAARPAARRLAQGPLTTPTRRPPSSALRPGPPLPGT